MAQDFSKKMTIVIREDVESWQLTNTVGHIAAFLGNKMTEQFDTGTYFVSKDGLTFPRNSQYAIIVLKATREQLENLACELRKLKLIWIVYVQDMIDMIDDEKLAKAFSGKPSDQMDILGIGMFGLKEELKTLTHALQLWK